MLSADILKGFVTSCLVKDFDGALATPDCHMEWWDICCNIKNKFVAIAAPRGHAKSTAITLCYSLASVLFRERSYVLICSDTETQASLFLGQIRSLLQENETIISLFRIRKNEKGVVDFIKDSETDIIVAFEDGKKFRIMAKGSGQKLRGLLWDGKRPDLIICDDMENEELVLNKDRREAFRRWFFGALLPCRSSRGIVRVVGTILHMDSLLERLMPNPTNKRTIIEDLKIYSPDSVAGNWKAIKYRAHNPDFSQILWPAKHTKETLTQERENYIAQGMPDLYSQEFLNVPLDESRAHFKRSDFLAITDTDVKKNKNYYISADLAISEQERADYSAFVVGGVDEDGVLQIVNVIKDRMDGREIVNTLIALQRMYNPLAVGIEEMQVSKAIGPFLNEEMRRSNVYLNLVKMKPAKTDKVTRSYSIQARMRAGGVKFMKNADWYQDLEDEMCRFPKDKHDDQVDAMAYLGLMLDLFVEGATNKELAEEEQQEEMDQYLHDNGGASEITGY